MKLITCEKPDCNCQYVVREGKKGVCPKCSAVAERELRDNGQDKREG